MRRLNNLKSSRATRVLAGQSSFSGSLQPWRNLPFFCNTFIFSDELQPHLLNLCFHLRVLCLILQISSNC